jgi:hypothetical protein
MKQFLPRPAEVTGRAEWFTIGWEVSRLDQVLRPLQGTAAMIVDAQNLDPAAGLVLTVSVVGNAATNRTDILGFPVVALQQFGTAPSVEVAACVMAEEQLQVADAAVISAGS